MSDPAVYERVRQHPKFKELVTQRGRLAYLLSFIVLGSYYSFMMVVAFAPELLRIPLWKDSALTVGTPIGTAIVVVSWLLTGGFSLFAIRVVEQLDRAGLREVLWGALPYVLVMILGIVILCIFPGIATWLPDLVMGTAQ